MIKQHDQVVCSSNMFKIVSRLTQRLLDRNVVHAECLSYSVAAYGSVAASGSVAGSESGALRRTGALQERCRGRIRSVAAYRSVAASGKAVGAGSGALQRTGALQRPGTLHGHDQMVTKQVNLAESR